MDYFAPGLREISRILGRQWLRARWLVAERRLGRAEATLGLLGWQQADFDDHTQAEVSRLVEYEREQARATNESAELGRELHELNEVRGVGRNHYEVEHGGIETTRRQITEGRPEAERHLAELRRIEPTFERRMPELDRELRLGSERYAQLLAAQPHSAQVKQELRELRERAVAIPNERADLRMQHLRTTSEIHALETRLEKERGTLVELERRERELADSFKRADAELAGQIKELERRRGVFDQEFTALEGAKANPYREVGRVLADNGIAPLNQPQALEAVKRGRIGVQECEHALAVSEAATAEENPDELRVSLRLWCGLAIGAVFFVIALIVLG